MIHKLFEMYDEPEVIPTWPEEFIPNVLVCPICLSIPFDPWVETKCSRVFCKEVYPGERWPTQEMPNMPVRVL